jgi:hypothetical protein
LRCRCTASLPFLDGIAAAVLLVRCRRTAAALPLLNGIAAAVLLLRCRS